MKGNDTGNGLDQIQTPAVRTLSTPVLNQVCYSSAVNSESYNEFMTDHQSHSVQTRLQGRNVDIKKNGETE